jgi:N-acetylmuramoyl-L-alanine amidase
MLLSNPIWNLLARWRACLVIAGLALGLLMTGSRVWAQVEVPALKGDGIFSLLRRHGLDPESNLAEFRQLNGTRMAPGDTLIEGRRYVLPGTAGDLAEPLFGPKLSRVKRLDDQLRGAVFYLVSGHGGPDPGGMGKLEGHTLYEDEYAYDVTLRFGRRLMEHGARVRFIVQDRNDGIRDARFLKPDTDEVSYSGSRIPAGQKARLKQRVDLVNSLYRKDTSSSYRRCFSIHVDARSKATDIDIFFYYQSGNALGKRLALTMRDTIRKNYRENQPGRGYEGSVTTRGLYVLKHCNAPLVFMELGNIHHARDQVRLVEANNRQAIANWLCEGVIADYKHSHSTRR